PKSRQVHSDPWTSGFAAYTLGVVGQPSVGSVPGEERVMTSQHALNSTEVGTHSSSDVGKLYQEGIVAGVLGAAAIALWFLILDTIQGRPLYTPTVLGTALFKAGHGLESPQTLAVSFDMVLVVTWVHLLIFAVVGGLASRLLALAEERPNV